MSFGVYTYELKLTPLRVPDDDALEFAEWLSERVQADGYWGEDDTSGPIGWDHMMELVDEYCARHTIAVREAVRDAVMAWVDSLPWEVVIWQGKTVGRSISLWFGQ